MDFNESYIKNLLPKRPKNAHKGTFGHVLNVAGSAFYTGAAYFSSITPLKVGAGKVTLASTETVTFAISTLSPDIILLPVKSEKDILSKIDNYNVISIGCGLSTSKWSEKLFKKLLNGLKNIILPVVIDADGLNILAKSQLPLPQNTILTPHPAEMARLMEVDVDKILSEPEYWAKECSKKYKSTVILKAHESIVVDTRGRLYKNKTGNSALAKGGSGDVLTGMITGFLAQGLSTFEASVLAVYLHGLTGEIASQDLTEYSVLASELINYIPKAIKEIMP